MHIYNYVLFSAKSKNLDLWITMSELKNKTIALWSSPLTVQNTSKVISCRGLALGGSDILRDLTVTNCCMKAMKQRDYFITSLPICKWGSGVLTINELHINRTEHWMTVSSIAFIIKEKPWQISASFYILLKWSGASVC